MVNFKVKKLLCLAFSSMMFISGIVIISFGAVLAYKMYSHTRFVPGEFIGPFIVLFVVGIIYIQMTWLGVKGPTKEHDFHVLAFVVLCAAIFILEFAFAVWAFILYIQAPRTVSSIMKDSLKGYIEYGYDKKDWILLESRYQCCGVDGPSDYKSGTCSQQIGCSKPFIDDMRRHSLQLVAAGVIISVQMSIGFMAYYYFYKALGPEKRKRALERRERLARARSIHEGEMEYQPPIVNVIRNM